MTDHRYRLEKYKTPSSRYRCPGCGQQRRFTRYIDTQTGCHLADHVGRCDRQDSCGYHHTPKQYFEGQRSLAPSRSIYVPPARVTRPPAPSIQAIPPSTDSITEMPESVLYASMQHYEANHFVQYLRSRFDAQAVERALRLYYVGTSAHWPGATVFWQIDAREQIRAGKVMLYDPHTGRRVKEPHAHISWAHTLMGMRDYSLRQCLFGEHLIAVDTERPIGIVESEKTAIIASLHLPGMWWLATGGKEQLTPERLAPLRGRRVYLYPDSGASELWSQRASELRHIIPQIRVNPIIEQHGAAGMDIADYL